MCYDFDATSILRVPAAPGAYRLYRNARIVYVGMAAGGATLRSELRRHFRGDFGPATRSATEFEYCEAADAFAAYQAYLELYVSSGLRPFVPAAPRTRRANGRPL